MTTARIAPALTPNAITILKTRYLIGDETPQEMFTRVARAVALAEAPAERERWEATFYNLMASTRFLPNSPTLFNAGTGQGTLSACFVLPVEDTMESIMQAATASAMIQKYGGGLGYTFGKLRPRGSKIATTQGKACGPIAVLKMLSSLSDMITQGGKRHGANMGILPVEHPEVLDFIHMKDDDQTAQNFNISVAVTDAFMESVEKDQPWQLINPHNGKAARTVPARQIWTEIIQSAWKTGDPGLFFIDEANRTNPTPHVGRLESTNPCGEVPLLANEACNLGSIDLGKFVVDETGIRAYGHTDIGAVAADPRVRPTFDFKALEEVSAIAARFLDNVVTINTFPTQEVTNAVALTRKTGLGVMGWHDALVRLGIPYESEEALELAHRVMGTITDTAREVSLDLAQARGPYPAWQPQSPGERPIRNATRTCIAPTGTISAIAGASSGIEPIFALAFVKNVLDGKQLREVNADFDRIARERGFYSEELMDAVARTGSCQALPQVPEDVKRLFKVANEVSADYHVRMQAVFQEHTDLAVSKTINMAHSATVEDVEKAYWLAYHNRCKGITIYRDGSKSMQVLEVQKETARTTVGAQGLAPLQSPAATTLSPSPLMGEGRGEGAPVPPAKRPRPMAMQGVTERVRTGHGNTYITINFDEQGRPFEVFTTLGKAGSCDAANLEAISRLVSLALRSGIPAEEVIDQLQGITCHPVWDQGELVRSAPDAVALAIKRHVRYVQEGTRPLDVTQVKASETAYSAQLSLPMQKDIRTNGQTGNGEAHGPSAPHAATAIGFACPECGGPVAFQEGCVRCQACAWNQCGG
ncbi:MAG: adenosylcobalamin-dependent ribonucleoside-diphosphate reductase [Chloroflexi bacterium]|nr:adenosylcobalamin-dependent ribonucleoside-diphosphate reductase [Chloroflexota bacterium]